MATVVVHNKAGERLGEITGATFAQFFNDQKQRLGGGKIGVAIQNEGKTSLITCQRELAFLTAGEHNGELLLKVALPPRQRECADAWKVV